MVSLLHLADITEQGVTFASPVDGSRMLLTPEHSIAIQNKLGARQVKHALLHGTHSSCIFRRSSNMHDCERSSDARPLRSKSLSMSAAALTRQDWSAGADIIMALDDVVSSVATSATRCCAASLHALLPFLTLQWGSASASKATRCHFTMPDGICLLQSHTPRCQHDLVS